MALFNEKSPQNANALMNRVEPNDLRFALNELLLRSLNIVRSLDHAFEQLANTTGTAQKKFYNGLRRLLAERYGELLALCADGNLFHCPIKKTEKHLILD